MGLGFYVVYCLATVQPAPVLLGVDWISLCYRGLLSMIKPIKPALTIEEHIGLLQERGMDVDSALGLPED